LYFVDNKLVKYEKDSEKFSFWGNPEFLDLKILNWIVFPSKIHPLIFRILLYTYEKGGSHVKSIIE
jgi:hypothetical protein